MVLTDTHCHLDFDRYDQDRLEVLERARQAGVGRLLVPGLTETSSRNAVDLAESRPEIFAAIGVHPNEAQTWNAQSHLTLERLSASRKVVAIGEIGLDYYRQYASHDQQIDVLKEQLLLAAGLELPVIIHLRDENDAEDGPATCDLMKQLQEWTTTLKSMGSPLADRPGVLHSFAGSPESARAAINLGFLIGVTGPVTFKNAPRRQEVIAGLPLGSLLVETDAPFLTPAPHRGQRNEPAYVKFIAEKIAGLQSRSLDDVAAQTTGNASRLFNWGKPG